jgi:gas vesicle protein GvpL/GvpF
MPWYVFALVDTPPHGRLGRGLRGPLRARPAAGAFAIVERRADVPPAELGSLRAHQSVVSRLAMAVPAILPVRFGTLMDDDALDETLTERDRDIADALALVRHRVQFTWRRRGAPSPIGKSSKGRHAVTEVSGTAYLRRAATAAPAAPPAAFRVMRDRLHAFVVREKFQAASNGLPDTLYQLIEKTAIDRYRAMADALTLTFPALSVSGPWPPFAFAAELL